MVEYPVIHSTGPFQAGRVDAISRLGQTPLAPWMPCCDTTHSLKQGQRSFPGIIETDGNGGF
jgi:hypothetical protein